MTLVGEISCSVCDALHTGMIFVAILSAIASLCRGKSLGQDTSPMVCLDIGRAFAIISNRQPMKIGQFVRHTLKYILGANIRPGARAKSQDAQQNPFRTREGSKIGVSEREELRKNGLRNM